MMVRQVSACMESLAVCEGATYPVDVVASNIAVQRITLEQDKRPCPPFKALPVPDTVRDSDPAPCASARAMRQAINRHPKGHRNGLHPVPQ